MITHLTQYILYDDITAPDPEKKLNFQKHIISKMFSYFEYPQLSYKPKSHEDKYSRSNDCIFLLNNSHSSVTICSPCCSLHKKHCLSEKPKDSYFKLTCQIEYEHDLPLHSLEYW